MMVIKRFRRCGVNGPCSCMNKNKRYIIRNNEEILGSVLHFCNYYKEIKKYIEKKKIKSSLDRGAFVLTKFYLNSKLCGLLGEKRNSLSFAYGPEIGDLSIRTGISELENLKYGTTYSADNIAMVPGAWSGVEFVLEELSGLKKGKANKLKVVAIGPTHYQMFHRAINMLGVEVIGFDFIASPQNGTSVQSDEEVDDIFNLKPNVIFITNPNNPHGAFFPVEYLKKIITRAKKLNMYVVIDEIQDFLRLEGTGLSYGPWINAENVIRIDSYSKKRAIAEYRVGWVIAHKSVLGERTSGVIGRMSGLMGNAPRAANTLIKKLIEIEKEDILLHKNFFAKKDSTLVKREAYIIHRLKKIKGVTILKREACINITIMVDRGLTDLELSKKLMEKGVLMMPCSGYGYSPTTCVIRITFAERWSKIIFGVRVLEEILK